MNNVLYSTAMYRWTLEVSIIKITTILSSYWGYTLYLQDDIFVLKRSPGLISRQLLTIEDP